MIPTYSPEDIYWWENIYRTHSKPFSTGDFWYDEFWRDAGWYISTFLKSSKSNLNFDINRYNFTVIDLWDNRAWYIRCTSKRIHNLIAGNTDYDKERNGELYSEFYPDTRYVIALNYEDFLIAILGFHINKNNEIEIVQLQATSITDQTRTFFHQKHHFLDGFDWAKVLVSFFESYLWRSWYTGKLIIRSGWNNTFLYDCFWWGQEKRTERFLKNYDTTAQDLGYSQDTQSSAIFAKVLDFSKTL